MPMNLSGRQGTRALIASASLLGGLAAFGIGPMASTADGSSVNTFTLSGKYHGTLKLANPTKDCFIDEFSNTHLVDTIRFDYLTGSLTGLTTTSWYFVATEPKQGTFTTKLNGPGNTGRLRPENNNVTVGFFEASGTIKFGGKTGSVNLKVVFNNGYANTVTETLTGSWSCPKINNYG
ncbi:MAG: hypothetical protein ACHQFZ_09310 [Acidimicrobiales bacterium]